MFEESEGHYQYMQALCDDANVKLVKWSPKEPPIAIGCCEVVVNVQVFIKSTLGQLIIALADPKRWVGWTAAQLIDRLHQVGVTVEPNQELLDARSQLSSIG